MELHIPTLAPETLFHIGKLPITNTIVNVWLAIGILIIIGVIISRKVALKPGKMQNYMEFFLEKLLIYFDQVTGDRKKHCAFYLWWARCSFSPSFKLAGVTAGYGKYLYRRSAVAFVRPILI